MATKTNSMTDAAIEVRKEHENAKEHKEPEEPDAVRASAAVCREPGSSADSVELKKLA